jgi:hypothetical protein
MIEKVKCFSANTVGQEEGGLERESLKKLLISGSP